MSLCGYFNISLLVPQTELDVIENEKSVHYSLARQSAMLSNSGLIEIQYKEELAPEVNRNTVVAPKRKSPDSFSSPMKPKAQVKQRVNPTPPKVNATLPAHASSQGLKSQGSIGSVTFGRDMNGNFICPFPSCAKSFTASSSAHRHFESAHSGAQFKCQICEATFNRKDTLKQHAMKKHNLNEIMARAMLTTC